jgi:hypothetical protein
MRTRFPENDEPDGWDVILTSAIGLAFLGSVSYVLLPLIGFLHGG